MESLHQQRKAEAHALKMRVQELEGTFADAAREDEVSARFVNPNRFAFKHFLTRI